MIVLDGSNLAQDDWIRIDDGSRAEYRQVDANPVGEDTVVPLHFPLNRSHAANVVVNERVRAAVGGALTLVNAAGVGATTLTVAGATAAVNALAAGVLIEIGGTPQGELRFLPVAVANVVPTSATDSSGVIRLDSPLERAYAATTPVVRLNTAAAPAQVNALNTAAAARDPLIFLNARGGNFTAVANFVVVAPGTQQAEARRIGDLGLFTLRTGAYEEYPTGSVVERVTVAPDARQLTAAAPSATPQLLTLNSVADLVVGQTLVIGAAGPTQETGIISLIGPGASQVTLIAPLATGRGIGDPVVPAAKNLTAAIAAGGRVLTVDNRMGLAAGDLVSIGAGAALEWVEIVALPAATGVAPDSGNVQVRPPVARAYPVNTPLIRQGAVVVGGLQASALVLTPAVGGTAALVSDGTGYAINNQVRVITSSGEIFYHDISAATVPTPDVFGVRIVSPAGTPPHERALHAPLRRTHPAGSAVEVRTSILNVQALDAGEWGNRLRVVVEMEEAGLVTRTDLINFALPTRMEVRSLAGIEPGTVLEVRNPLTDAVVGGLLKVQQIDRSNRNVTLAGGGLDAAQQAEFAALPPGRRLYVRSREFRLSALLLRQPDPALPSRNDTVIDSESFRQLSMDPRHSRYVERVIGAINGPLRLADRRSEGEGLYIRVQDQAQTQAVRESIRLGPEALVDRRSGGRATPAWRAMLGGDDSVNTLTDAHYIGVDNPIPELRTGLQSLRNIEEISIVAIPGRTSVNLQGALIIHSELMRYRFVVLDGPQPPNDAMADVQEQRQQFDTKYAAIYYPWLLIPEPFPPNLARIANYPVPPSGHVVGIYARTDIERGVHKAPANESVRGILGLQRILNKEHQDILNPSPVNINVIRDFRNNNRGIRVFGGRVITSDTDWKYVNVRRLLIFIENSIDRGLQWVVFEPNAEPLWARVRRSISNFLTTVWRNGALEGTTTEEAYFVRCDRTTMTQTDIDNGRLICVIGVAPVKPAEYVIIQIGLWTAHAEE